MKKLTRQQALDKIKELQDYVNGLGEIDDLLAEIGNNDPESIIITRMANKLYIALPNCNTDWTFEAWRIASELVKRSNQQLYIQHGQEPKDMGNVIEIRSLKHGPIK